MKILIVDDSRLDRQMMIMAVREAGFKNEIIEAVDGEDGLRQLSDNILSIALILLDWEMPKVNGLDFMKAVLKVPELAVIPVVMVTVCSSEESQRIAYEANPKLAGYVVKPYKTKKLIEAITPHLAEYDYGHK